VQNSKSAAYFVVGMKRDRTLREEHRSRCSRIGSYSGTHPVEALQLYGGGHVTTERE
jgi:hypothetical protein